MADNKKVRVLVWPRVVIHYLVAVVILTLYGAQV